MSATEKYEALKKQIADARKQMEETAKNLFNEISKELFDANPELISFGWNQYTPYFNDGNLCTFRVSTSYPRITILAKNGETKITYNSNTGEYLDDDGNSTDEGDDGVEYDATIFSKLEEKVTKFLGIFEDDDLETMFGDHQQVTVNRTTGVDTEDYDHD